jgi:hypothetical protein
MKRHGDPKKHGTAAITEADFERIPDIIRAPDHAIIGATRKGTFINAYVKADSSRRPSRRLGGSPKGRFTRRKPTPPLCYI